MTTVETICGLTPDRFRERTPFRELTAIDPDQRFNLAVTGDPSTRLVDLVAPIGKGTRGLIVAPPKAGKTMLLERIAAAIRVDDPETRLVVLLIDERPEEVTHFRRAIDGAEVFASSSDQPPHEHVQLIEFMLAHIRLELECGHDVVVLLDGLTRLVRAFNLRGSGLGAGRTLSGGLQADALQIPRRFFGLARNIENGGSVTILSTVLVDTGSRMDQAIFEEFKGTGNSELILDRKLAEKRIYPSIDVQRSGTRREELLLEEPVLKMVWTMRRMLGAVGTNEGIELLLNRLSKTDSNAEFLASLTRQAQAESGNGK